MDILSYIVFIGFTATEVANTEIIQITDAKFEYPCALRYITNTQSIVVLPIMIIWTYYKSYSKLDTRIIKQNTKYNANYWFIYYTFVITIIKGIGGALVNVSLQGNVLTVPTSKAIGGMKPMIVLILSVIYLKQKLILWDIMALFMVSIGILFFIFELSSSNHAQTGETHDTLYGVFLTVIWTFMGAFYEVMIKNVYTYCIVRDKIVIGSLLFSILQGIFVMILFPWFLFFPTKVEWNSVTTNACTWIIISGTTDFVKFFLGYLVVAWKSPFWLSIGYTFAIPVAFVVDVFVHNYQFNIFAIIGTVCIITSILLLEMIRPTQICSYLMFCEIALVNGDDETNEFNAEITNRLVINKTNSNNSNAILDPMYDSICKQSKSTYDYNSFNEDLINDKLN